MSLPSTPSSSRAASAESSPGSSGEASPMQLTPRSKIKAMMAAIDEDSDDEPANIRTSATSRPLQKLSDSHGESIQDASTLRPLGGEKEGDATTEDDEIIMPRGKMAARLRKSMAVAVEAPATNVGQNEEAERAAPLDRSREGQAMEAESAEDHTSGSAGNDAGGKETGKSPQTINRPVKGKFLLRKKFKAPESGSHEGRSDREREAEVSLPDIDFQKSSQILNGAAGHVSSGSESEGEQQPARNARFLALVARKKEERRAKEAAAEKKRAERQAALDTAEDSGEDRAATISDGTEDEDIIGGTKLTQQSRPVRKASKKAIEEMNRETQRISRNMQLAHECKVKKKYTIEMWVDRMKKSRTKLNNATIDSSAANSSLPGSDAESARQHQTPLTSPLQPESNSGKGKIAALPCDISSNNENVVAVMDFEEVTPEADAPLAAETFSLTNKGKGKAIEPPLELSPSSGKAKKPTFKQRPIKIHPPKHPVPPPQYGQESDSDLEIVPISKSKNRKLEIFDRLPVHKVSEDKSLLKLRALAHLTSPSKKMNTKSKMTAPELQISLQRRARQQAVAARNEKIQDLKARGIIVQTAEERERDQAQVEDMLEKARREADELTKQEKAAAKKEARANGEDISLLSSDEDEDYEEEAEASAPELSGSEEEDEDEDEKLEEVEAEEDEDNEDAPVQDDGAAAGLIHREAEEEEEGDDEGSETDEHDHIVDGHVSEEDLPATKNNLRKRNRRILDDEDDEQENDAKKEESKKLATPKSNKNPFAAMQAFDDAPMGLTQAFAATMADTQVEEPSESQEQDSIAILRAMPAPDLSMFNGDTQAGETQDGLNEGLGINLHLLQSQTQEGDSHPSHPVATQYSELPDPTQDQGFGLSSPVSSRFAPAPPSTVDTVIVPAVQVLESPIAKKKGRLLKRKDALAAFSDLEDSDADPASGDAENEISANAFDVMKKAVKEKTEVDNFDKKKSRAKDMVEEQAEESEDEYAGLGGASDDGSGDEEDEEMKKMIDEGEVDVNERKIAAFYADKERATDEKAVEKLFKDINNGMLRRKRGAEFDLSDSEDDIEDRRRRKRAREQRMRNALLQNESIGKIAEDPKKLAFLRAIEDRDEEDEDEDAELLAGESLEDSQAAQSTQEVPESQLENGDVDATTSVADSQLLSAGGTADNSNNNNNKRKRNPLEETFPPAGNRPPPHLRRSAAPSKKPATLAEIRASVSFLTESPHELTSAAASTSSSSGDEDEDGDGDRHQHQHHRRRRRHRTINPLSSFSSSSANGGPPTFVDRLSLKRAESASLAEAATSSNSRLAFHDPTTLTNHPGFRVPSLLRRATTSQLTTSSSGATDANGISHYVGGSSAAAAAAVAHTERAAGGGEKGDFVRRGGSRRSGVTFLQRHGSGTGGSGTAASEKVAAAARRRTSNKAALGGAGIRSVLGRVVGGGQWE